MRYSLIASAVDGMGVGYCSSLWNMPPQLNTSQAKYNYQVNEVITSSMYGIIIRIATSIFGEDSKSQLMTAFGYGVVAGVLEELIMKYSSSPSTYVYQKGQVFKTMMEFGIKSLAKALPYILSDNIVTQPLYRGIFTTSSENEQDSDLKHNNFDEKSANNSLQVPYTFTELYNSF